MPAIMNTRTTALSIDGRSFWSIPALARTLGAISIRGKVYVFSPLCLETAKRAAGSDHVAVLRADKQEIREATDLEIAYLRGVGMDQIEAHSAGGFDILPATSSDAFRE